jgi:hypothetical protein
MSVEQALDNFGKYVVQQSRSNLTKDKTNVSKDLYNSISYTSKVNKNSFELTINMVDYGKFIDKGVKGSESSAKAPKSPYKYTTKMPPSRVFDKWSVKRSIAPRDAAGRFISRKSINFAIARSIFKKGIRTTNFFTKPFERAFKELPEDIVEAYGLEVDSLMQSSLT